MTSSTLLQKTIEFWFKLLEYLLLAGVIRYLAQNFSGHLKWIFVLAYLFSFFLLFFFLLNKINNALESLLIHLQKKYPQISSEPSRFEKYINNNPIPLRISSGLIGGLISLLLSLIIDSVVDQKVF